MVEDSPMWLESPRPPSKAVYRRLRRTSGSLMRELMNLEIEDLQLSGRVLDVGGGSRASYRHLLGGDASLTSVDIDPGIAPSVVCDLGRRLPFSDGSFDAVVSFNTLEHLADDQLALNEMVRVLRSGGRIHVIVPFLYRVHAHPDDFHRHTAQGWNLMLRRAGLPDTHQRIRPVVWDPLATAWAIADVAALGRTWWRARRLLRPLVLRRPLLMSPVDRRLIEGAELEIGAHALGFVVQGEKPSSESASHEQV